MMKIKHSNAYAALLVLTLIVTILIGFYMILKPYGVIYEKYMNDTEYGAYLTQEDCTTNGGYWEGTVCQQLPDRAKSVIDFNRRVWLVVPIIFVVGLIIWYFTVSTRRDPQSFYLR